MVSAHGSPPGVGLPEPAAAGFWVLDLVARAVSCPGHVLGTGLALAGAGGLLLLASRWSRPAALGLLVPVIGILAWILRDRLHLLGDARVWMEGAGSLGWGVHVYREPLAAKILGGLAWLTGPFVSTRVAFAAMTIAAGLGTAWAVRYAFRDDPPPEGRAVALAFLLVWLQPAGVLFWGQIETYPLFLLALAAALGRVRGDLCAGRVRVLTLLVIAAAAFTHYLGALLLPSLLALGLGRSGVPRGWTVGFVLGLALLAAFALAVPAARDDLTLAAGFDPAQALSYGLDVLSGWVMLFVPLGILALVRFREAAADPYGRFLLLAAIVYLLVPVVAHLRLGIYRDFGLLGPAFLALVFLVRDHLARGALTARGVSLASLAGAPLLAMSLVLHICPDAGLAVFRSQLSRPGIPTDAASYGHEILAYVHEERGEPDHALREIEDAIRVTPKNERLYGTRAGFRLAVGDSAGALRDLVRSLDSPRAPRSVPLLLELYSRSGRHREAVALGRLWPDAVRGSSRASAALGVSYFRLGHPDSMAVVAEERLAVDPEDHVAYANLGSAAVALDRVDEAAEAFRAAAGLDPGNLDYRVRLVRALLLLPDGERRAALYLETLPADEAEILRNRLRGGR